MEKVFDLLNANGASFSKYGLWLGMAAVFLGVGQTYITVALGVAYPAFMSFLALESDNEGDDTQWLTYWVIFGLFNIVDQWSGFILHFIPFYFVFKLCFLVYLFHPSTKGATSIYKNYILPTVKEYEPQIAAAEARLSQISDRASGFANKAKSSVMGQGVKADADKKDE